MNKVFKIICISLLVIGLLSFAYPVLAQGRGNSSTVCREGNSHCAYPGECHDYIDFNNDGFCDRTSSIGSSSTKQDVASTSSSSTNSAESSFSAGQGTDGTSSSTASESAAGNVAGQTSAQGNGNRPGNSSGYNILLISIIVVLTYGFSYLLSRKKVITLIVHRKIWNILLFVSTLAMLILSLLLTLQYDYRLNMDLPFDIKFWHVEIGIVMGVIAFLHICWHWRYFIRFVKNGRET